MRLYSASSQETQRARELLKDWADGGFLTQAQYRRMEQETVSELRTTNIFLRLVLFLFTAIIVGSAVALFFVVFRPSEQTSGVFLLIFAGLCYMAAESTVTQARLFRFGIEEALAACSVGFLCLGMDLALFSSGGHFWSGHETPFLVFAAGGILSLWIWHRFRLWYAFFAAMIFVVFLPSYWTSSHESRRLIIIGFYVTGLAIAASVRPRHRLDYLNNGYSLAEAFLWLGTYLTINLQISSLNALPQWWVGAVAATEFSRPFYWTTWVLIWCLPPVILASGLRRKDRLVIAAGAITAVLTFVSNKPYLGWPRHTWDPMLLGALLTSVALFLRRWLARGPGGIRNGFTAERLSAKHKDWINAGSVALGVLSHDSIAPEPPKSNPGVHFGGGDSGGGGATEDF